MALASSVAQAADPATNNAAPAAQHATFDELLSRHVSDGLVDYAALKKDDAVLRKYLSELEAVTPSAYAKWSDEQRIAFWVNAYNAYTIRWILDHYPTDGIWQTVSIWKRATGGPFAVAFIPLGHVAGKPFDAKISLNDVEHEIIRKRFDEPRTHFALVCASTSCPELRDEAYEGASLSDQLDDNASDFLRDRSKNRFDAETNTLRTSKIFDWFSEDFEAGRGPKGYFLRYGPPADIAALEAAGDSARVDFLSYDWSLNDQ